MTPEESLRLGNVDDALAALAEKVRSAPADPALRRFLFQLLCVVGKWEKALTQLQVLAEMDSDSMLLAEIFRPVVACEMIRAEVFKGTRSPLIFGEPMEWIGQLVQANTMSAAGQFKPARELREQALNAAPAVAGTINGEAFEWIGDADSRLGPVMEAVIDGKYFWVPFERIARLSVERPSDLRDLVWIHAKFGWTNGGEAAALLPVRYPGSEEAADGGLRLARKTEWLEREEETFFGLGQKMLATDQGEFPLLEVRTVEMSLNAP
ncbi:MAG: type VI secretion system accessory protein TagJ [Chthoniobacter sp.]